MPEFIDRVRTALSGRYAIERELGAGGMATVYLAEDLRHRRKVAVKVLRPDLAASLGAERFLREIALAARLQHPHILPLHESGEAEGLLYYVMPYVEGQSLRDRLDREGAMPVQDAVRYLGEVADALAHAHEQGVVHRDVKPDNVMLSGRHALVMDFGVAKAVSDAAGVSSSLTSAGLAVGTPAYMAPEQASADPAMDHRVDIYAFGAMAYEMLGGSPPFSAGTPQQTLAAHLTKTPARLSEHRPAVPPGLERLVMRCLEKNPADRWQRAAELVQQLEQMRTPSGGTASATVAPPFAGRPWLIAGLLLVAGAATVLFLAGRRSPAPALGQATQLTADPGLEIFPALSPDGKFLAYAVGTAARMRIFIRTVSGERRIPLSDDSLAFSTEPQWSSDGNRVLFLSNGGVYASPALGGGASVLVPPVPGAPVVAATWSPDGKAVAYVRGDSLLLRDLATSTSRLVASESQLSGCSFGPDGRFIVCSQGNPLFRQVGPTFGNLAPSRLLAFPAAGGPPVALTDAAAQNDGAIWLDARRLLFLSNRQGTRDVYAMALARGGAPDGEPVRITTGLNPQAISVSRDGRRLAYAVYTNRANIWSLPIPGGAPASVVGATPVTSGNQVIEAMKVSRGGRWLVYDSNLRGSFDIWRIALPSGEPERLTTDPGDEFVPDLSPDGRYLAYHSFQTGSRDIFVRSLETGSTVQLSATAAQEGRPLWSPVGDAITFTDLNLQGLSAWVVRKGAGETWGPPARVATGAGFCDWSSDGTRVYCIRQAGGIVSVPAGGGAQSPVYLPRPGSDDPVPLEVRLDPAGRTIYFKCQSRHGYSELYAVPVAGGVPRLLVRFDDATRPSDRIDFATDGRRLYFPIQDRQSDVWVADLVPR